MDDVHPQLNTIESYGSIKKRQAKLIKTNNRCQRTNIFRALNLATKEVLFIENEQINCHTMIALLKQILKSQKQVNTNIVLGNARCYYSIIVNEFLKEHPRIILKSLPVYLNTLQSLWKIINNKFYLKFDDFRKKVFVFLKNDIWKTNKFKNILIDKFQIVKPNFLSFYLG